MYEITTNSARAKSMKTIKLKSLLEYLHETPDRVVKIGAEPYSTDKADLLAKFSNNDALAFICTDDYAIVGTGNKQYHHDLGMGARVAYDAVRDEMRGMRRKQSDIKLDNLIENKDAELLDVISKYEKESEIIITNHKMFLDDIKNTADFVSNLIDNSRNIPGFVSGRFWKEKKIISFWNNKTLVLSMWEGIEDMMKKLKINDFFDYDVDWVERVKDTNIPLTNSKEISTKGTSSFNFPAKELSKDEMLDLLKQIHVAAPAEKKEILRKLGADIPSKASRIADKLGITVAQFNYLTKLDEKKLNEDPDTVFLQKKFSNDEEETLYWDDPQAQAFAIFPEFSLKSYNRITHKQMDEAIEEIMRVILGEFKRFSKKEFDLNKNKYTTYMKQTLDSFKTEVSDLEKFFKYIIDSVKTNKNLVLAKYVRIRNDDSIVSGRIWQKNKIVSFWNKQSQLTREWNKIKEMFETFNLKIDEYEVDLLERRSDMSLPFTSLSSLNPKNPAPKKSSSNNDDKNQTNFIDQLFAVNITKLEALTPSSLKKIREKLHILDPQEKQKFAKQIYSMRNKAAEIADALNMTIAEFNSLTKLDENKK